MYHKIKKLIDVFVIFIYYIMKFNKLCFNYNI